MYNIFKKGVSILSVIVSISSSYASDGYGFSAGTNPYRNPSAMYDIWDFGHKRSTSISSQKITDIVMGEPKPKGYGFANRIATEEEQVETYRAILKTESVFSSDNNRVNSLFSLLHDKLSNSDLNTRVRRHYHILGGIYGIIYAKSDSNIMSLFRLSTADISKIKSRISSIRKFSESISTSAPAGGAGTLMPRYSAPTDSVAGKEAIVEHKPAVATTRQQPLGFERLLSTITTPLRFKPFPTYEVASELSYDQMVKTKGLSDEVRALQQTHIPRMKVAKIDLENASVPDEEVERLASSSAKLEADITTGERLSQEARDNLKRYNEDKSLREYEETLAAVPILDSYFSSWYVSETEMDAFLAHYRFSKYLETLLGKRDAFPTSRGLREMGQVKAGNVINEAKQRILEAARKAPEGELSLEEKLMAKNRLQREEKELRAKKLAAIEEKASTERRLHSIIAAKKESMENRRLAFLNAVMSTTAAYQKTLTASQDVVLVLNINQASGGISIVPAWETKKGRDKSTSGMVVFHVTKADTDVLYFGIDKDNHILTGDYEDDEASVLKEQSQIGAFLSLLGRYFGQ